MKPPIVIVGVGALGSHLGLLLRNWACPVGLYPIRVCDFDRVEKKNVMSQFHTTMGVGRNKAQAFQQALQGMFGVRVEAIPHRLTSDNAEALLGGAALVIDCTDNAEARRVIQGFVKPMGIPCLHGCLGAEGTIGRVVWTEQFKPDEAGEAVASLVRLLDQESLTDLYFFLKLAADKEFKERFVPVKFPDALKKGTEDLFAAKIVIMDG